MLERPKEGEKYKRKGYQGYQYVSHVKVVAVTRDGNVVKIDTVAGTFEVSTAFLLSEYDKVK